MSMEQATDAKKWQNRLFLIAEKVTFSECKGSTMVQHLTHNSKIQYSNRGYDTQHNNTQHNNK